MKKTLLTLLLTLSVTAMTAQSTLPAPAVGLSQIARLFKGEDPEVVLQGLGLEKIWYNYCETSLCCCTYGRHIKYENICQYVTPLADDAYGITYCDAGPGCWEIVFKDDAMAEAYRKDLEENGYVPLFENWQECDGNNSGDCKFLEYIYNFDEEYCGCAWMHYNGMYYTIRLEIESCEGLRMFWLRQLPALKDAPLESYMLESHNLTDLTHTSYDHTSYCYSRNFDYNTETFERKITGPDAMLIDYSAIEFSNRQLMKLYIDEAKMLGYLPMDTLGWKDLVLDGKIIGKEMKMYKNQDGLWGGWYGDVINFIYYEDYCCVMLSDGSNDKIPVAERQPAITIADLELLASGKTTDYALRQKIRQAGQEGEMEVEGLTIRFKDRKFVGAYELEARELGYNVKREEEGRGGWNFIPTQAGPNYWFLTLYKGKNELHFCIEEGGEIELFFSESTE